MAFHPGYATKGFFFVGYNLYTKTAAGTGLHYRVARFSVSPDNPSLAQATNELFASKGLLPVKYASQLLALGAALGEFMEPFHPVTAGLAMCACTVSFFSKLFKNQDDHLLDAPTNRLSNIVRFRKKPWALR